MKKFKINLRFKSRIGKKYKTEGNIVYYFIYDNGLELVDQKIYLNYGDNQIVSNLGAKHYNFSIEKNADVYNIRKKLIKNSEDSGRKMHGKTGNKIMNILKDDITDLNNIINDYIFTITSLDGFMTGSNPGGSFTYINNTPYVLDEKKYDGFRFIQIFKKLEKKRKNINYDEFESITFDDFLSKYDIIEHTFQIYNKDLINYDNGVPTTKEWIDELNKSGFKLKDNDISKIQSTYENGRNWKKSDRSRIRFNVINRFTKQPDQIFNKYPVKYMECAHIYNVSEIDIKKEGKFLVDADNGIMMNNTMHKAFDRNDFTFDEDGNIKFNPTNKSSDNDIILNGKLDANIRHLVTKYPRMKIFINKRNKNISWI